MRQDRPSNRAGFPCIAALTHAGSVLCMLLASALMSHAWGFNSDDIKFVLLQCCFIGSEYTSDRGLLLLQEPIHFRFVDLAGLERYDMDILGTFFSNMLSKSGITFSFDDPILPSEMMKSGMVLVALPAERSDLTDQNLKQAHDLFARFYTVSSHEDKNVDTVFSSIIDHLYTGPGALSQYSLVKAPDHLIAVLALARMRPGNIAAPETMEPVILQSLGYNVAGAQIGGSIFTTQDPDPIIIGPTDLDYDVLRTIYRRKDIRILRSLSDVGYQ